MRSVLPLGAGLAIVAVLATCAEATPIGSITTVDQLTFALSDDGPATDIFSESPTPINDTRQFSVTLNTSQYTGSAADVFTTLALKFSANVDAVTEAVAPDAFAIHTPLGGLNNGGCHSSGTPNDNGFFCTESSSGVPLNGSFYTWTFLVDPTGAFDQADIKAQWFDADGNKLGQLSQAFGPPNNGCPDCPKGGGVPEPTTLLLLSCGLAATFGARHRRRS
jgi:hypothetical protein